MNILSSALIARLCIGIYDEHALKQKDERLYLSASIRMTMGEHVGNGCEMIGKYDGSSEHLLSDEGETVRSVTAGR